MDEQQNGSHCRGGATALGGAQQPSQLPLVGIFGGSARREYDAFLQAMHGLG